MVAAPAQDSVEVLALMFWVEVWPRAVLNLHPVVRVRANVGVAHHLLSQQIDTMIYAFVSVILAF